MRKFEKISFNQFQKDVKDDLELYNSYSVPERKTKKSAGYDFEALFDFTLHPNEIKKIPLGIKVSMNLGEMLLMVERSSMGFKYNIRFTNQVGIVDADYYNNKSNEGHLFICLQNQGKEDFIVQRGQAIWQGIFVPYVVTDDDKEPSIIRQGGYGSTDEKRV